VIQVAFRPYRPSTDIGFLFAAWIGSYKTSDWAGVVCDHVTYAIHKATINQLLARGMKVVMAVNPDDEDQILGFVAYEVGPVLHFCFVKDVFRRQGVAKQLLEAAGIDRTGPVFHTFRTDDARYLGRRLRHRPEFARRKRPYDAAQDGPLG
jgi:GNAT superfamily N-acetyltransferase